MGLRVSSTEVASARNSRCRLTAAWTSSAAIGAKSRNSSDTASRTQPNTDAGGQAGNGALGVVVAERGPAQEHAFLPGSNDDAQEPIRHQGDHADEDRHVHAVARVEIADVGELVADHALQLLAIERARQSGRDCDRGVARLGADRHRVGLPIVDDVDGRRRHVGRDRQLVDDVGQPAQVVGLADVRVQDAPRPG